MNPDLALQKLNELRQVVDGDMEEMVDAMATLAVLQQDMSDPMLGAKVTVYDRPDGEWVKVDSDEFVEKSNDDLFWRKTEFQDRTEYARYKRYEVERLVEGKDDDAIPDEFNPEKPLEEDIDVGERMEDQWEIYENGYVRVYKRKTLVPAESLDVKRGIVFEANVSGAPKGEYWDPNKEEYKNPSDYPLGTVNVVIPKHDDEQFGEDYVSGVEEFTSLTPAEEEPAPHTYTPGWD